MWENARIPQSATSVFFSGNITALGGFSSCHALTEFIVPDTVTKIGDRTFALCTSLTSVTVPNRVESIGEQAFRECTSLKTVTLPSAVKVHDGETASFTVKAIGDGLKYQWVYKKSGSDTWYTWSDKTSASVSGSIPQSWNGRRVRCRVTDSLGKSVYSDTVSVTVK